MPPILIYNTSSKETVLLSLAIDYLRKKGFSFTVFSRVVNDRKNGKPFLPHSLPIVLIFSPLWYGLYLGSMLARTIFSNTRTLVCFNWPEKIILTPVAKLCKWRVIWLELPDTSFPKDFLTKRLISRIARKAEIIVFSAEQGEEWKKITHQKSELHITSPFAYPSALVHQDDLFQALAERPRHRFVIAAVLEGLEKELIERLLSALAIGLTVCSILELMIIGDGERRKQLLWLIRKMGLGNHVWLVGGSKNFLRWLGHVDMFVLPHEKPSLEEIATTILVMNQAIPVLGNQGVGLGEVITSKTGALIDMTDSETLARQFLRLEQAGDLRKSIGRAAKEQAEKLTFEHFVEIFSRILSEKL